jgi:NAD(P)H-nitrite reductase large subunit
MIASPPDQKPHLVVIGNGMAGCRAVEEILARETGKFRITIFGAEPRVNYNRIMLSPVLAGEKSFEDIVINGPEWYDGERHRADLRRSGSRNRPRCKDSDGEVRQDREL